MITLERILVPVDFSDCSKRALSYAMAFCEKFDADLHLLHVVQDLAAVAGYPETGGALLAGYADEMRQYGEKALAELIDPDWEADHWVARQVVEGTPFVEIVRYARDSEIDLIALGTHGRSGLSHLLMGSVAEKVVRKARCPVLTVRPDGHQFVMP